MWNKKLKKTIFLLNVDNYAPQITELTYPYIQMYAEKIGAQIHVIRERKFPDFPPVYEKLQIYELAKEMENDWNIYIDSDALVHPDCPDVTALLDKNTILHNGTDFAPIRWKYDRYFQRDGRHIGSCNWFTIASDLNIELWKPLDDLTLEEAIQNIYPIQDELNTVVTRDHLIDDYTLSRNIAKYGLKATTFLELINKWGLAGPGWLWHEYQMSHDEKVKRMKEVITSWNQTPEERRKVQEEKDRKERMAIFLEQKKAK